MNFFSYIDPGTGSIIVQALIGLAVGVGVLAKTYWAKIRSFFGGKKTKDNKDLRGGQTKDNG